MTGLLLLFALRACVGSNKTPPNTTEDGGISNAPELTEPQLQGHIKPSILTPPY